MRKKIRRCTPRHYTKELKDKIKDYSTEPEFEFESRLNDHIRGSGLKATRIPNNARSKQDIHVYEYDYKTLAQGRLVCKIDIEQKISDDFSEYPNPPARWSKWSFLCRKTTEKSNGDRDVYVLYSNHRNPCDFEKIFWSTFLQIRHNCHPEGDGSKVDTYYRCSISKDFVERGLDRLAGYLVYSRDNGLFSKEKARKTSLSDFGVPA